MPLILNIDTATEFASVCISKNAATAAFEENKEQKSHASFLQPAIKKLLQEINCSLNDIDAIAVTNGPGSYTGLRVGLASAKGICFAINKPLILLNTLEVMSVASRKSFFNTTESEESNYLLCPMIDARRMEVFTALYDVQLNPIIHPTAMILDSQSFVKELENHSIVFSGSGSIKMNELIAHQNAIFCNALYNATNMIQLAEDKFLQKQFANLAYSSPNYCKEFYTPAKKL